MTSFSLLSDLALVEAALPRAERAVQQARDRGLHATACDCSGLTVAAIDALARVLVRRGYRVERTVGVTDYRHTYPLLRIAWQHP